MFGEFCNTNPLFSHSLSRTFPHLDNITLILLRQEKQNQSGLKAQRCKSIRHHLGGIHNEWPKRNKSGNHQKNQQKKNAMRICIWIILRCPKKICQRIDNNKCKCKTMHSWKASWNNVGALGNKKHQMRRKCKLGDKTICGGVVVHDEQSAKRTTVISNQNFTLGKRKEMRNKA